MIWSTPNGTMIVAQARRGMIMTERGVIPVIYMEAITLNRTNLMNTQGAQR
jgi:hypothetical protein